MSGEPAESEPRWLSADEQSAWRAYLRGSREVEVALEKDLAACGLSLSEYELISMLSEAPGGRSRMSTLADFIVQSRSRVTHTTRRLEARGWVQREPAPDDGRGVVLVLTAQGRETLDKVSRHHVASVRARLIDVLNPEQLHALGDAMQTIRDAIASTDSEVTSAH